MQRLETDLSSVSGGSRPRRDVNNPNLRFLPLSAVPIVAASPRWTAMPGDTNIQNSSSRATILAMQLNLLIPTLLKPSFAIPATCRLNFCPTRSLNQLYLHLPLLLSCDHLIILLRWLNPIGISRALIVNRMASEKPPKRRTTRYIAKTGQLRYEKGEIRRLISIPLSGTSDTGALYTRGEGRY
jgi:hypothetical protein